MRRNSRSDTVHSIKMQGTLEKFSDAAQWIVPTDPAQVLAFLTTKAPAAHFVFSTSFSREDQIITHTIASQKLPIHIFTIDTGRHFPETYKTMQATRERYSTHDYNFRIETYFPKTEAVEKLLSEKGPYSFYNSPDERIACCAIRKVEPLTRALANADFWITGIRKAHSPSRHDLPRLEVDKNNSVYKIHPLLDMTDAEMNELIHNENIPYNKLQDRGFLSIGCEPCTRAVKLGESMRAGRWWWENTDKKECGLHTRS